MGAPSTKREIAAEVLDELFATSKRVTIADAVAAGAARGVSRRTLSRVGAATGIRAVLNGRNGGIWEKPE